MINPSILALATLGLAELNPWLTRCRRMTLFLGIAAFVLAIWARHLDLHAPLPYLLILEAGLFWVFYRRPLSPVAQTLVGLSAFGLGFVLLKHWIPGAHNWVVAPQLQVSPLSAPWNFWLNFDKPLIAVMILACAPWERLGSVDWKPVLRWGVGLTAGCVAVLVGGSFLLGLIRWDPKWVEIFPLWALTNLVFVVITEEVFFRLFLQRFFITLGQRAGLSWMWGLVGASVFFALLHLEMPMPYIVLSAVAGLFYGYAFHRTGRIEAAIAVHFLVNVIHFLCFTYPFQKMLLEGL